MSLNNLFSFLKEKEPQPKSLVLNDNAIENIEEFIESESSYNAMNNENTASILRNRLPEFQYIEDLIKYRLNESLNENSHLHKPELPDYHTWKLQDLAKYIVKNMLERAKEGDKAKDEENNEKVEEVKNIATLLLIALIPHIQPELFERVIDSVLPENTNNMQLGGVRGKNSGIFQPTGETALFLIAGDDWERRIAIQKLFTSKLLVKRAIISFEEMPAGEPPMSGRIILAQKYFENFAYGNASPPKFSSSFPAEEIKKPLLEWEDVVLTEETRKQIDEVKLWAKCGNKLLDEWNLKRFIKPGFRVLFYGPPGTGKTLTASLLGKELKRKVYRVDISTIVSKYIGETEKNLSSLFAQAENKNWILFFDEADAIFGKRTGVKDAHDKYANQEVSYLLQRIETYNGLVILATNQKSNIDDAFIRRFNVIANFAMPNANERAEIWKNSFPSHLKFENVDFNTIAQKYELAGGNIINVVHYACLKAYPLEEIKLEYILEGIKKEYNKDGKMFKA